MKEGHEVQRQHPTRAGDAHPLGLRKHPIAAEFLACNTDASFSKKEQLRTDIVKQKEWFKLQHESKKEKMA